MILSNEQVKEIVKEIGQSAEVDRRALAKRRIDIYKDGGKNFLIEQIKREFGEDALKEMRLAPVNLLKKIVNKLAGVYKKTPTRTTDSQSDQKLLDFYTNKLDFNVLMQKLNRYLVLNSNAALYIRPYKNGELRGNVSPAYQYSQVGDPMDQCDVGAVIFSAFTQAGQVTPDAGQQPATGVQGYSQQQGFKSQGDLVDSNEKTSAQSAPFLVFWTDEQHFTTDGDGNPLAAVGVPPEEQFKNPIEKMPVVLVARDRDNEVWAKQGEDMIDLTIAIQMGWTDVLTIAKHQGFSLLTITSPEKPEKLNIGVNRAIWNKMSPDGKAASIGYVQAQSPLAEYMGLLTELLGLLLSTNGVSVGSITGGKASPQNFTSGFHALIAAADSLESVEDDKPIMRKADCEAWEMIAAWHNWMFDGQLLSDEAKALGKFSPTFKVNIVFAETKPLESIDEVIARIKALTDLGLLTRRDALKMLNPTLDDKAIDAKLKEIDAQKDAAMKKANDLFQKPKPGEQAAQGDGSDDAQGGEGQDDDQNATAGDSEGA